MNLSSLFSSPFEIQLGFYQIIDDLEKQAEGSENVKALRARALLKEIEPYPELRNGITDVSQIENNQELIGRLLEDYFPPALTLNEIKAVNIPYTSLTFNYTRRFRNILDAAGPGFDMTIRDFDEHQFYVMSCCIILNEYYGTQLDFSKPLFYDIPAANGVSKHYRILYNADFLEILPTENAIALTQEDIDLLLNNYGKLELWKEKFPEKSWLLKGFAIMTLFDVTVENAVSILKEKLLTLNSRGLHESIESIFRSIYRIPDLQIGFTVFNQERGEFVRDAFGRQMPSFILQNDLQKDVRDRLGTRAYRKLIEKRGYFAVADTAEFGEANPESEMSGCFVSQFIRSFILAPVVKNNRLLGLLEVVSKRPKELNSINANKLEVVMPFLTDTVERQIIQIQNQVQAVIQSNYTTIHSSVYWKFREEAQRYIADLQMGIEHTLNEIIFPDVYPLYGQVDIKGSSEARNMSVQKDLQLQIRTLLDLFEALRAYPQLRGRFREETGELNAYLNDLKAPLKTSTEQLLNNYLEGRVHPLLRELEDAGSRILVDNYFTGTNQQTGDFHAQHRRYEKTISSINNKMARILDKRQEEAQAIFPHYYERFKTDGVEHNLYAGPSITPAGKFDAGKLEELRLWQLRVLCEMETAHHRMRETLPYPLEVTTLILVYHSTLSIRFRMDEKRFDVDGSYNARFEIIKKRIDKAFIKDTRERITEAGKLTVVYANDTEGDEYLKYIEILQSGQVLDDGIEQYEVEDLQGVSGLKMLRVRIVHPMV